MNKSVTLDVEDVRVLLYAARITVDMEAVLLSRDSDVQWNRSKGRYQEVRDRVNSMLSLATAVQDPEFGADPSTDELRCMEEIGFGHCPQFDIPRTSGLVRKGLAVLGSGWHTYRFGKAEETAPDTTNWIKLTARGLSIITKGR